MFLDRGVLKKEARMAMANKFFKILLVVLLFGFFTNIIWSILTNVATLGLQNELLSAINALENINDQNALINALSGIFAIVGQIMSKAALFGLIGLVVNMVLQLSYTAYFIKVSKGGDAGIISFFKELKGKRLLDSILLMLLIEIKILLWSLLFVIPGIIKSFSYMLAPYIKAENPDIKINDAIKQSCELMDGKKGFAFVLILSFLGWALLGAVAQEIVSSILEVIIVNATAYNIVSSIINLVLTSMLGVYMLLTMARFYVNVNMSNYARKAEAKTASNGFSFFKDSETENNGEANNTEPTNVEEVDESNKN